MTIEPFAASRQGESARPRSSRGTSVGQRRLAGLYLSWAVALVATLGALFVGEVLGQTPCVLCWYQRIAMFPLALILGVACLRDDVGVWRYALPLAFAGGVVALYHSGLYLGLIPEPVVPCTRSGPSCTDANMTVLGLPLPLLSLASFLLIAAALGLAAHSSHSEITS